MFIIVIQSTTKNSKNDITIKNNTNTNKKLILLPILCIAPFPIRKILYYTVKKNTTTIKPIDKLNVQLTNQQTKKPRKPPIKTTNSPVKIQFQVHFKQKLIELIQNLLHGNKEITQDSLMDIWNTPATPISQMIYNNHTQMIYNNHTQINNITLTCKDEQIVNTKQPLSANPLVLSKVNKIMKWIKIPTINDQYDNICKENTQIFLRVLHYLNLSPVLTDNEIMIDNKPIPSCLIWYDTLVISYYYNPYVFICLYIIFLKQTEITNLLAAKANTLIDGVDVDKTIMEFIIELANNTPQDQTPAPEPVPEPQPKQSGGVLSGVKNFFTTNLTKVKDGVVDGITSKATKVQNAFVGTNIKNALEKDTGLLRTIKELYLSYDELKNIQEIKPK